MLDKNFQDRVISEFYNYVWVYLMLNIWWTWGKIPLVKFIKDLLKIMQNISIYHLGCFIEYGFLLEHLTIALDLMEPKMLT